MPSGGVLKQGIDDRYGTRVTHVVVDPGNGVVLDPLRDQSGPSAGQRGLEYIDIVVVGGSLEAPQVGFPNGSLDLQMELLTDAPKRDPNVSYQWALDVDGNGFADYEVHLEGRGNGAYFPLIWDGVGTPTLMGDAFPGTFDVIGNYLDMSVPFETIGWPPTVSVRATTEKLELRTSTDDTAPEHGWLRAAGGP